MVCCVVGQLSQQIKPRCAKSPDFETSISYNYFDSQTTCKFQKRLDKKENFLNDIKSPLIKMELKEITIFKHNNQNVDTTLFTDVYNSPKKIDKILEDKIKQEQLLKKYF